MIAFVLSGGASLGAIQVGMVRALYERDIPPDLIIGTSAGALNGAFIASRPPTIETAEALADVWRGVTRNDVFPLRPLTGLFGFIGRFNHLVPERPLRSLLRRHLEFDRLEDASIPLHVIATEVESCKEVRLSRGDAIDAVMASAAIPAVFPPVEWEDSLLMDGGVSNNSPITHAIELGAGVVYVLPTGYACALDEPPRGALGMLLHAMNLLIQRRLIVEIELLESDAKLVVLPPPCPLDVQAVDFSRADELIERAFKDSSDFLDRVDVEAPAALLAMHSERLQPHSH
jgi:NTE family protein